MYLCKEGAGIAEACLEDEEEDEFGKDKVDAVDTIGFLWGCLERDDDDGVR